MLMHATNKNKAKKPKPRIKRKLPNRFVLQDEDMEVTKL